jgi:glycosyltransferase involved in cell wall biosynthesis
MPILEAMSLGTPVITSSISSMPEVAGDAALLVDPYDPEDISRAMERVCVENDLREHLRIKGYEQVKNFSWSKNGAAFLNLFDYEI